MGRKRPESNYSLSSTFETPAPAVIGVSIPEGEIPIHQCFWYQGKCTTRSGKCGNMDSPGCVCPVKPKEK